MLRQVFGFIKTMILGGLLFLFPLVIVTAVVGKAFKLMLSVTEPLDEVIPADSVADVAVINLVAIAALLVGCFVAGLVAQSHVGRRVYRAADANLAGIVPGYAALRARLGSAVGDEERQKTLKTVLVRLDDQAQMAFEVERLADGRVVRSVGEEPGQGHGRGPGRRSREGRIELISLRQVRAVARSHDAVAGPTEA